MDTHDRDTEMAPRRSFIKHVAALGCGAAVGLTGLASAQPAKAPRRPQLRAKRTGGKLGIKGTLQPVEVTQSFAPTDLPPPPKRKPAPEPSSRDRILRTIQAMPGGDRLLDQVGIDSPMGDIEASFSDTVRDLLRDSALTRAYADGVRVTPTGCRYTPSPQIDGVPAAYHTYFGVVNYATMSEGFCYFGTAGREEDQALPVFAFTMEMPGRASDTIWYTLELSLYGPTLSDIRFLLNGTDVEFVETDAGTWFALAAIPGSDGDGLTNSLQLWPEDGFYAHFNWLNITVL